MRETCAYVIRIFLVAIIGPTIVSYAQGNQCATAPPTPACYNNVEPYQGHGPASGLSRPPNSSCTDRNTPGCPGDDRRIVVIRIAGNGSGSQSWDTTPGHTDPKIFAAVECAIKQWNTVKDNSGNPSNTGYFFYLDQGNASGLSTADITVAKASLPAGVFGANNIDGASKSPDRLNLIGLDPANTSVSDDSLCGRIAHEIGHLIGLGDIIGASICNSIMTKASSGGDGSRAFNRLTSNDVLQANRYFSSRGNCNRTTHDDTGQDDDNSGGGGGGGGDDTGRDSYDYDTSCEPTNPYPDDPPPNDPPPDGSGEDCPNCTVDVYPCDENGENCGPYDDSGNDDNYQYCGDGYSYGSC